MPIEILGPGSATRYDVLCLSCNDISLESGDYLDRPLEIIGFEEKATLEKAKTKAEKHNSEHPDHSIKIRGFDFGAITRVLYEDPDSDQSL